MAFARSILVSDWAMDSQPNVNPPGDEPWAVSRTEENFKKMPRKLFCKCGHVSEGEIAQLVRIPRNTVGWGYVSNKTFDTRGYVITKHEQPPLPTDFNPNTDDHLIKPNIVCPECGEAPNLIFEWKMARAFTEYDFVRVFDNRTREENNHTICLSIGFTEYFFNKDVEKISAKSKIVRLTYNTNTGMTYAIKASGRTAVTNASYGMYPGFMGNHVHNACARYPDEVLQFMRLLIDARLEWTTLEQILAIPNWSTENQLTYVTTLCAMPQLQCLPFVNYSFTKTRDRKKIRDAGFNGKALFELIAGSSTKQVRKYVTNENRLYSYLQYRRIFKDQNNLMKILSAENQDVSQYGNRHVVYGLAKNFLKDQGYIESNERREKQVYQFMMNLHKDEAHFSNNLVKVKQQIFDGYEGQPDLPEQVNDNPFAYVQPVVAREPKYRYEFHIHHAWHMVMDSVRMLEDILMRDMSYKWEYDGNLQEFHDTLSRDLNRYRNPYKEIPYSDEEKEIYNRTIKGYTFRLAESNHELVKVGSEQNICVGGYGDRAVQKQCVIVLMENEKGEHRITIELNPVYEYMKDPQSKATISKPSKLIRINQAKLRRNNRPMEEEAKIVAEYCYETNTRWEGCHDMQAAVGSEWPEIPTGQAPIWHEAPPRQEEQRKELAARRDAQLLMGIEPDPIPQWQQPRFVNGRNNMGPPQGYGQAEQQPVAAGFDDLFDDVPF